MKINKEGLEIIKKWEGCRLNAYRCPSGVLTIGYGHTGNDVTSGMKITTHKAEQLLMKDIKKFENVVNKYNEIYDFNENEFSALVSFAFNIGRVIAPSGLNIRETPSTNSKILKAIPFGNKLEIVERLESGWLHIQYGTVNGYVYGKWVV